MNTKDLEAARRLIAQFEDRATGRHNSTMFPTRPTELIPHAQERLESDWVNVMIRRLCGSDESRSLPRPRNDERFLEMASDWKSCQVGQHVFDLPGNPDPQSEYAWNCVAPIRDETWLYMFDPNREPEPRLVYRFMPVRIVHVVRNYAWRRIA